MLFSKRLNLIVFTLLLVGCAQTTKTRVNSFREVGPLPVASTVAVVAAQSEQMQSLEFRLYKDILEKKFVQQGFALAPLETAQLIAVLSYSIDRITKTRDSGVRTGVMLGSSRGGFGSNIMLMDGPRAEAWYERKLTLILENNDNKRNRIYEVTAQSEGACGVLSAVLPDMITALFTSFPMENGAIQYVNVPATKNCR